jgi:uncharacterized protein YceK
MKKLLLLSVALLGSSLGGCATIFSGTTQNMTVSANETE